MGEVPLYVACICPHDGESASSGGSARSGHEFISPKVCIKLFCKTRFPHKSVKLSFIVTDIKNKLTDLCGN